MAKDQKRPMDQGGLNKDGTHKLQDDKRKIDSTDSPKKAKKSKNS